MVNATPARATRHCGQHLADADNLGAITTWKADGVVVGSGGPMSRPAKPRSAEGDDGGRSELHRRLARPKS